MTLNYLLSLSLIWHHRQSRFSLSHFLAPFPHKIQAHNILHIWNPIYSHGPVMNPVYHQKTIKFTSCQTNNTLQQKVGAIANLQDPYLKKTSNVNRDQHSHSTSKYCSIMILSPGLELDCLRREGVAAIRYKINMSTKKLLKRRKLLE